MKRKNNLLKILSLTLVGALVLGAGCVPTRESSSDSSSSTTDSSSDSSSGTTDSSSDSSSGTVEYTPHWNDDGVLKILAIGNSFSEDAMEYFYQIAKAAGVEHIELGHLYIGGCSLQTHLENISYDLPQYLYSTKKSDRAWNKTRSNKPSTAFSDNDWDFITLQQNSNNSGVADTYDDLNALIDAIEPQCTNEHVTFAWHMTWAYQQDSDHKEFPTYNNDQTTMYNAIISAVQEKIVPNDRIVKIIPSGTAIQNARTSYLGDNLTRDGYHLSDPQGRFIAGTSYLATLIEIDLDSVDLSSVCSDPSFVKVIKESVKNAIETPFSVTPSAITEKEDGGENGTEENSSDNAEENAETL